jgi:Zn-finger nucleic acid-binding protein
MRTEAEVAAMSCPVCRVPLSMSDRQGVEIDYCPQCRGVWLDRGELDKIIERSSAEAAPPPPPQQPAPPAYPPQGQPQNQYAQPHSGYGHQSYGKPYKKRKSWLEDIVD